jgi:hypothetical protein
MIPSPSSSSLFEASRMGTAVGSQRGPLADAAGDESSLHPLHTHNATRRGINRERT